MNRFLELGGNLIAILGVVLCLAAGVARIGGLFYVAGFEAMTLFNAGMALMLASLLAKVHVLGAR